MSAGDRTEEQLRAYFRDRIDGASSSPAPEHARPDRRVGRKRAGHVGLWFARIGVAAVLVLGLLSPLACRPPCAPGAGVFGSPSVQSGIVAGMSHSLWTAHQFIRTYFGGEGK